MTVAKAESKAKILDAIAGMTVLEPVSYTHLDVYKRQPPMFLVLALMFVGS